ncbi:beta-galactosidase [Neocloeon triangulifer]|uniref:beta-galactosidase n=1 Tax=Neocloeon triangulifer TaxID=2078957 RepID=UPI00286F2A91|nr:beta-galactosidase [Neocloeon triangulifer]
MCELHKGLFLLSFLTVSTLSVAKREFYIDYENDQFVKDGEPFKYVSGSFHYFRTPSVYWRDRLRKMKQAGLNAVSTYVEWRSHETLPGKYDFSGDLDLENFLKTAQEEGLLVLLRPGPYICAERDFGGLPSWLMHVNPKMKLRTRDVSYMGYVRRWFTVLFSRISPYFYGNGGPIIMVQVENEYGSYPACDLEYIKDLRDILQWHTGKSAVLYSTDGNSASYMKCSKVDGVYATVDFGTGANVSASFLEMKVHEPTGPLVNSEFYPGWLDHWAEKHNTVSTVHVIQTLEEMFKYNASVNFYMFYGGTNFGFTAGANFDGFFYPQLTSYDYDAPLTEAGDPTAKYMAIRAAVNNYLGQPPSKDVPVVSPKGSYGNIDLKYLGSIFDLCPSKVPIKSEYPLSFEQLMQSDGYVLYKTVITKCYADPAQLVAKNLNDRGNVFVNKERVGILSRINDINSMPISVQPGDELEILVENQGRINYGGKLKDFKGMTGNITIEKDILKFWSMLQFPFQSYGDDLDAIYKAIETHNSVSATSKNLPSIFWADFQIQNTTQIRDTFLDTKGWSKGIAFINGFNLGRFWPRVGPQRTLYLPGNLLNANSVNRLVIIEFDRVPPGCIDKELNKGCFVSLRDEPVLNALCQSNEVK